MKAGRRPRRKCKFFYRRDSSCAALSWPVMAAGYQTAASSVIPKRLQSTRDVFASADATVSSQCSSFRRRHTRTAHWQNRADSTRSRRRSIRTAPIPVATRPSPTPNSPLCRRWTRSGSSWTRILSKADARSRFLLQARVPPPGRCPDHRRVCSLAAAEVGEGSQAHKADYVVSGHLHVQVRPAVGALKAHGGQIKLHIRQS